MLVKTSILLSEETITGELLPEGGPFFHFFLKKEALEKVMWQLMVG